MEAKGRGDPRVRATAEGGADTTDERKARSAPAMMRSVSTGPGRAHERGELGGHARQVGHGRCGDALLPDGLRHGDGCGVEVLVFLPLRVVEDGCREACLAGEQGEVRVVFAAAVDGESMEETERD